MFLLSLQGLGPPWHAVTSFLATTIWIKEGDFTNKDLFEALRTWTHIFIDASFHSLTQRFQPITICFNLQKHKGSSKDTVRFIHNIVVLIFQRLSFFNNLYTYCPLFPNGDERDKTRLWAQFKFVDWFLGAGATKTQILAHEQFLI